MSCQPCGCDPDINWKCSLHSSVVMSNTSNGPTAIDVPTRSARSSSTFVNRKRLLGSRATLPDDPKERKHMPIASGVLFYFPDAIAEVARVSWQGNEQHNPGQTLHWAREKSTDHLDCIARHLLQVGERDTDGMRHSAKLAWRALANLQLEIERDREHLAEEAA